MVHSFAAGRGPANKADMTALADERREGAEALHVASGELEKLRPQSKH